MLQYGWTYKIYAKQKSTEIGHILYDSLYMLNNFPIYVFTIALYPSMKNLGHFYLLALLNSGAMNMCVHVLVWISDFSSFGYAPRSQIAGSYG